MPKLLVFQHVAHEILGTLDPLLRSHGFRIRYVNFEREPEARVSVASYHGLIVLGGPMNVDEVDAHPHLAAEVEMIQEALALDRPILGICLGAQLLAKALGARVGRSREKEIGWYPVEPTDSGREDPLFEHFAPREHVFQWHGDSFELPEGCVHLARSPGCENQAFRYGDRAYGLQFHLEVDRSMIGRWLRLPDLQSEIEALHGSAGTDAIHHGSDTHLPRLADLAEPTFLAFLELFEGLRRRGAHPHDSR